MTYLGYLLESLSINSYDVERYKGETAPPKVRSSTAPVWVQIVFTPKSYSNIENKVNYYFLSKSLNCLIKTKAQIATHTETKTEKYNTISLAAKSKKFKKYHKPNKHWCPYTNKNSM